jgi:hypothetical protein
MQNAIWKIQDFRKTKSNQIKKKSNQIKREATKVDVEKSAD